jgi:hypothetical protein
MQVALSGLDLRLIASPVLGEVVDDVLVGDRDPTAGSSRGLGERSLPQGLLGFTTLGPGATALSFGAAQ